MNCRKAEEFIYLYEELGTKERRLLRQHLDQCSLCAQLFESAQSIGRWRSQIPQVPPIPDEAALTQRIMNSAYEIRKREHAVWSSRISLNFSKSLRYGMAALSLLLVLAFTTEYSAATFDAVKPYKAMPGVEMQLNTASFHDAFLIARKVKGSAGTFLSRCMTDCVYGDAADCSDCGKHAKQNQTP